jgi:hypothetical protein
VDIVVESGADAAARNMLFGEDEEALTVTLILGFILVDFLFFYDVRKAGEVVTFPQYLTGILSVPVVLVSAGFLLRGSN